MTINAWLRNFTRTLATTFVTPGWSRPTRQNALRICRFDLDAESTLIEFEQRVVPFGRGTADAIADEDHAVSMIDSAHDRPLYADIGLGTRNDEAVCLPGTKMVQQEGFKKKRNTWSCRSRWPVVRACQGRA